MVLLLSKLSERENEMSDIDTVKEQLVEAERDLKTWEETLKKEPYNVLAMDRVYKLTATV